MDISPNSRILFIENAKQPMCFRYVTDLIEKIKDVYQLDFETWYINREVLPEWEIFLEDKILIGNEFNGQLPQEHWCNTFIINSTVYTPIMSQYDYIFITGNVDEKELTKIWEAILIDSFYSYEDFLHILKKNPQGIAINMDQTTEPHEKIIVSHGTDGSFSECFTNLDYNMETLDEIPASETNNFSNN